MDLLASPTAGANTTGILGLGSTNLPDHFAASHWALTGVTTTSLAAYDGNSTEVTSQAGLEPDSVVPKQWTAELVAEYIVRLCFAILMVLVNTLVLVALGSTPALRRCATNLVIGSLSVTDLLVGVMGPAGLLIELEVVVQPFLCKLGYAGVMALSSVSINHLLFVSVDRYLMIMRPLHYGRLVTKRRVWAFVASCWLWGLGLAVPYVLDLTIQPAWLQSGGGRGGLCRAELMMPLWLLLLLFTLHFVLPIIVMAYVYGVIFCVASRQRRAIQESFRSSSRVLVSQRQRRASSHQHPGLEESIKVGDVFGNDFGTAKVSNGLYHVTRSGGGGGGDNFDACMQLRQLSEAGKDIGPNGDVACAQATRRQGEFGGAVSERDVDSLEDDSTVTTAVGTPQLTVRASPHEFASLMLRRAKAASCFEMNGDSARSKEEKGQPVGADAGPRDQSSRKRSWSGDTMLSVSSLRSEAQRNASFTEDTQRPELTLRTLTFGRGSVESLPLPRLTRSCSVRSDSRILQLLKEDKKGSRSKSVHSDTRARSSKNVKGGRSSSLTSLFRTYHKPLSANSRAKLRAARLLVLPCGFFYLTWGPWFGLILWAVSTGTMVEPHGWERLAQAFCMINSLGNPVLYAVSQPQLGRAMLALVARAWKACRTQARCLETGGRGRGNGRTGRALSTSHAEDAALVLSPQAGLCPHDELQSQV